MEENNGLIGQRILIIFLILVVIGMIFIGYILLSSDSNKESNNANTSINITNKNTEKENIINENFVDEEIENNNEDVIDEETNIEDENANIVEDANPDNIENLEIEQIILEGIYSMEASDVAYEFYNDGIVEYSTNMAVFKGTYTTISENELKIEWQEKTEWDAVTSEETIKKMSGREYVDIIDENNINVRTEVEGKTYTNEFTKFENQY